MNLARVGIEVFNLYDADKIELHNTASQAYSERDVGKYKVEAIKKEIKRINKNTVVYTHGNAMPPRAQWIEDNDYLVIAVDSMEIRESLCNPLVYGDSTYYTNIERVVDVRCGGEQIDVFNVERLFYRDTIRSNPDVDPCGAQFIAHVSSIAGALGAKEIVDCLRTDIEHENFKSYSVDIRNVQVVNGI